MSSWKVLANAAIIENEAVLLAKRADHGIWEFPGGKIKPGEQPRDAMQRELQEELSLDTSVKDTFTTYIAELNDGNRILHVTFLVTPEGECTRDPELHTELDWFSQDDLEAALKLSEEAFWERYAFGIDQAFKKMVDREVLDEDKH